MKSVQPTDLIASFNALHQALNSFTARLSGIDSRFGGWVQGINDSLWNPVIHSSQVSPHQQAANIFNCLYHMHEGDGRDSWQMAGLICVPEEMIRTVHAINKIKDAFAKKISTYKTQNKKHNLSITQVMLSTDRHTASDAHTLRKIMSGAGASRLHTKHCTRKIITLDEYPRAISLSWIKQRKSIKKITIPQCEALLRKIDPSNSDCGIAAQLNILYGLRADEGLRLRQVQTIAHPSIKGRVYWLDGSENDLGYLSMPAVISCQKGTPDLPDYTKLPATPPLIKRRQRSDAKLPETPLLPAIRVFLAKV